MKTIIKILFLFLPILSYSQDVKKVSGVTDTNVKKVSGVSDTAIKKISGVTFSTFSGLLDTYTGAGVAYSVRKLRSGYTGYCMRIERLSDNATLDVGFESDGDLDVSAITSFCTGSVDATVIIWYDQSGNGYDLVPDDGNSTLLICESGSVLLKNGRPAITANQDDFVVSVDLADMFGVNQSYHIGTFTLESTDFGSAIAHTWNGASNYEFAGLALGSDAGIAYMNNFGWSVSGLVTLANSTQYILEFGIVSSTNSLMYVDGVDIETIDETEAFTGSGTESLRVGGIFWGSPPESLQEYICWPVNQSSNRSAIYTNVAAYF